MTKCSERDDDGQWRSDATCTQHARNMHAEKGAGHYSGHMHKDMFSL